ncbi:flagellar protein FliS [Nitrosomonas cryotolerans]|uniref:Flagellar secretion chaperone FliS n=1 Tax=Nitrosomonas cryotolerans ATCC 49181 TaxID=1131553 RepID=A0A1N6I690_9PROT|nr:flagellar export chaperone FliS [Nitrosomonas cryotolerans]SFP91285.1 flagellar protein FliS [Nitrosomonas cryotolerans]SIO27558.1 flagellar protein FliS [Nitrosomonas cryotolerans ATCC 49181]
MYAAMNNPISTYQRIGIETGVESANPHKLILMLFEGAQEALAKAKMHLQYNEIAAKGEMLSKAIMIIDQGLKASLDMNAEGDIALQLQALYDYMIHRLLTANLRNDPAIINEVNELLSVLCDAWRIIGESDAAKSISGK